MKGWQTGRDGRERILEIGEEDDGFGRLPSCIVWVVGKDRVAAVISSSVSAASDSSAEDSSKDLLMATSRSSLSCSRSAAWSVLVAPTGNMSSDRRGGDPLSLVDLVEFVSVGCC